MTKHNSAIIRLLERRIFKENKNALIILVGDTGTGKSWASIGICKAFDPSFNIDRIAFMKASSFIKVIRLPGLKRGNAVIWDDVGKGLKAKEWYEMMNKVVTDILQTFRVRGLLVIMNVPDVSFIDKTARMLFHFQGEMVGIDMKKGFGIMKFLQIQINKRTGRPYHKYHVERNFKTGKKIKIIRFRVKKPPVKLLRQYERKKKHEYMKLEVASERMIEKIEEKTTRKLMGDREIIEDVVKRHDSFLKTWQGRTFIDPYRIMGEFEVGRMRATKIKSKVEDILEMGGSTNAKEK